MSVLWSLSLAEHPSSWGMERDIEMFGRAFSHPFIIVRDENGAVVEEIHGRWQNTFRTRQFIHLDDEYASHVKHGLPVKLPPLHPMAVVSPSLERDTHKAVSVQPFFEGTKEVVEGHIAALKENALTVNARKTPFYRYAVLGTGFGNCQSALANAIAMTDGFPKVPDLVLAHTGWTGAVKNSIEERI